MTLPEPGVFCAEAGETIEISTIVSLDSNDLESIIVLEIRKDGVRVALSADYQPRDGPTNLTILYKETLSTDAAFDIRIRVLNNSILPEVI